VSEVVGRPKLSRTVSAPNGQQWREIAEHEWPEGIAEEPAVKEARILGGRRSVRVWREGARSESGWGLRARERLRSSRIKFKNKRKQNEV